MEAVSSRLDVSDPDDSLIKLKREPVLKEETLEDRSSIKYTFLKVTESVGLKTEQNLIKCKDLNVNDVQQFSVKEEPIDDDLIYQTNEQQGHEYPIEITDSIFIKQEYSAVKLETNASVSSNDNSRVGSHDRQLFIVLKYKYDNTDVKSVIDPGVNHRCEVCNSSFTDLDKLNKHKKTHNCDICGKIYKHVANLKDHKRLHTGERPFQCKVCEKSFSNLSCFRKHTLKHTNKADERPFQCKACLKSYSDQSHFERHTLWHTENNKHKKTDYQCHICKIFDTNLTRLKKHVLQHK